MSEDIIQAEIYKWYHNEFCTKLTDTQHVIFAVPNGAFVSKPQAMKLKATGLVAGVSDMIIVQPNRVIFMELKTSVSKQSEQQIAFQKKVESLGFEYWIIRGLQDLKDRVQK